MNILEFPSEILVIVFESIKYIDDFVHFGLSCKKLYKIFKNYVNERDIGFSYQKFLNTRQKIIKSNYIVYSLSVGDNPNWSIEIWKGNCMTTIKRYNNEDLHGKYISKYDNGKIRKSCSYIKGKKDGKYFSYWRNGNDKKICNYNNGELLGKFVKFTSVRKKIVKAHLDGNHSNLKRYASDGKTIIEEINEGNYDYVVERLKSICF